MSIQKLKMVLGGALLFVSSLANAAFISDSSYNGFDTYIDSRTGLEWMDFNETDNYTSNQILGLMGPGQTFEGWFIPDEVIAFALWENIRDSYTFLRTGIEDDAFGDRYGVVGASDEDMAALASIVGSNSYLSGFAQFKQSNGWWGYLTYAPSVGAFNVERLFGINYRNALVINLDNEPFETFADRNNPTLLYRESISAPPPPPPSAVSGPNTLAIFALGLMGLASRRLKKQS
jgi:hypothetical protein